MTLTYLSVCSGIEAATVAWHPLGWQPVAFAEIEPFPSAVLRHHYPDVPNWGDMTCYREWPDGSVDVVVGGTPCQSFSVAGLRQGMADPRGNLALVFLGVVDRYRPRWVVWENVPGVRSSGDGRDFGAFLGGLAELGYGWAYRSLDAQYFGLAQRRERVFVVAHLGDWRPPVAVLFEPESLSGDSPPSRETGEGTTGPLASRPTAGGGLGTDFDCDGGVIPLLAGALGTEVPGSRMRCDSSDNLLPTIVSNGDAHSGFRDENGIVTHSLKADGFDASEDGTRRGTPLVMCQEVADPITAVFHKHHGASGGKDSMSVRRLTPTECERLMGFPDGYTLIPYRGKPAKDGPRYKALGNSMAVPVMRWIGERIALVGAA